MLILNTSLSIDCFFWLILYSYSTNTSIKEWCIASFLLFIALFFPPFSRTQLLNLHLMVASLTINSYRWSFVFVVAYSILWQSLSPLKGYWERIFHRLVLKQNRSKSPINYACFRHRSDDRSTSHGNANRPIDQPFHYAFIVARRSKQEVHQLPRFRPPFSSISNKLANIA